MKKENIRYLVIIAIVLAVVMNYDKIMSMFRKGLNTVKSTDVSPPTRPLTVSQAQAMGAGVGTIAIDSQGNTVSLAR
jgi:hypothetical protein